MRENYCYYYQVDHWHVAVFAVSLRDAQDAMRQYRHCQGYKYVGRVPSVAVPDIATGLVTKKQLDRNRASLDALMDGEPEQFDFFQEA